MRIGINGTGLVQKASIEAIVEDAQRAKDSGFQSYHLAEHPTGGLDALTVLTIVGTRVPDIQLGTAIIPTMPRHPMVLAGQAMTTQQAIGERLTLGIGLSHAVMMQDLGIGFDKPIRHLKEYLSVLMPLIHEGQVDFQGETISCRAQTFKNATTPCTVLVAALGPQALAVTGRMADGTTLAWVGPRTIREHIYPSINESAAKHNRPTPQIVATLPVCVTSQEDSIRSRISKTLGMYIQLPSYQAMFEREGVSEPGELALVGEEAKVQSSIAELKEAGVTEFIPTTFVTNGEERERTWALLKQINAELAA
ncbi:MAG: TIGR03564 family F420-dependent LLM class oxidoreductase [Pseudomonadota bacterium]